MHSITVSLLGLLLASTGTSAQREDGQFWPCNPTKNATGACTPNPGLPSSTYSVDFTKVNAIPSDWTISNYATINFGANGAEFTYNKRYDAPQLWTNFFILFGRISVEARVANGTGMISSAVLMSDDFDEIDFEFSGNNFGNSAWKAGQGQNNYFGKGITGNYDRGQFFNVANPQGTFHTYTFDWTADRLNWELDGQVIRTFKYSQSSGDRGEYQYPQTPSKLQLGIWAGGDPDQNLGTKQWAGGETDVRGGPYTMYVRKVTIQNATPARAYNWTDQSGKWQSIKALQQPVPIGGSNNNNPPLSSQSSITSRTTSTTTSRSVTPSSSNSAGGLNNNPPLSSQSSITSRTASTTTLQSITPSPSTSQSSATTTPRPSSTSTAAPVKPTPTPTPNPTTQPPSPTPTAPTINPTSSTTVRPTSSSTCTTTPPPPPPPPPKPTSNSPPTTLPSPTPTPTSPPQSTIPATTTTATHKFLAFHAGRLTLSTRTVTVTIPAKTASTTTRRVLASISQGRPVYTTRTDVVMVPVQATVSTSSTCVTPRAPAPAAVPGKTAAAAASIRRRDEVLFAGVGDEGGDEDDADEEEETDDVDDDHGIELPSWWHELDLMRKADGGAEDDDDLKF